MTTVDSVGWLAFLRGEALSAAYRPYLARRADLLCPTIIICEVCRRIELDSGEEAATEAAAYLHDTQVVPLDEDLATFAAHVGLDHHLPLADAIIYATALRHRAGLVTSDAHFQGLPLVTYHPRPAST
jgi:toxin FitB